MARHEETTRLNVTLTPERAAKLSRLAEQAYTLEGTLARSLLSRARPSRSVGPTELRLRVAKISRTELWGRNR